MSASQGRVTRAGALPGASPVTRIAAGLQRRSELTRACLLSVALVVAMRVVLGAVLVVSCGDAHCNAQGVNWFGSAPASAGWQGLLVGPWDRNDAVYYAQIALHGYASPSAVLGPLGVFFPLFPLLARLALPVTAGDPILAGLLVNSVLAAVALVLMFELAKTDFGARAGYRAMLLLGAGPAAFFLLAPLSEAAFLALTLAAVLAARSGRGLLAGLIAVAATLTRDQGILVAVPLALIAGERARSRWRSGHLPLLWSDASLALAPLAYLGFQWYLGGHGYAGGTVAAERVYMHTQAAGPWTVLAESVQRVVTRADVAELVNLVAVALLAGCIPLMWRGLRPGDTAYAVASLLVIVCHVGGFSPLESALRFTVTTYPVWLLLGARLRSPRAMGWAVAVLGSVTLLVAVGVSGFHMVQ